MTGDYDEYYQCIECGEAWKHTWNKHDKSNDCTRCPAGCEEFEFKEITSIQFEHLKKRGLL